MRPLLGCFVEIGVRSAAGGEAAQAAVAAGFAALQRAQALWSFHDPDSELSRLNRGGSDWTALSSATLRLLRAARAMQLASGGAFDCTLGGTLVRDGNLPDHGGPEPLERGEPQDIELAPARARLRRPLRLTLDGIAKGYAVDLATRAMRRHGAHAGWVNAGGDARAFGPLALAMQRRELDGRCVPLGDLRNAALASSAVPGPSPRQQLCAATFPGRILAPQGNAAPGLWTVLARSAWRADALTKVAACALAPQRAALVARLGGHLVEPGAGSRT